MSHDFAIIGAGISGAAAACELAAHGSTVLVEAEAMPGHHATGRSAALYTPNFGNAVVRLLNRAGGSFIADPPTDFADTPLLHPRGALTIAAPGEVHLLDALLASSSAAHPIEPLSADEALARAPLLRAERVAAAAFEPGVMDIDVDALHRAFLRRFRARGGELLVSRRIARMSREADGWTLDTGEETLRCSIVVNAAGAWAGEIAALAGAMDIGLVPKRRTAIVVDAPPGIDVPSLPVVDYVGGDAYLKPDAGRIMASLGDETPAPPHDVRPDEEDVAVLVDWLERESAVEVRRQPTSWAGLRSFVADGSPVVGADPRVPGFFWLAAQGGYGIMMAPALARASASLLTAGRLPPELLASGLRESQLRPGRFLA